MASSQHSLSNCDIVPSELIVELPPDYADDICDLVHGLSPCVNMPFGHNRMHEDLEFATANTVKVDLHLQSFSAFHTQQYDEQLEAMPGSFDDSMLDIDLCREARRIHHARSISAVESNESIISRYLQMQDLDSERTLAGAAEDTRRHGSPNGLSSKIQIRLTRGMQILRARLSWRLRWLPRLLDGGERQSLRGCASRVAKRA